MRDALSICSVGILFSDISECVSFLIKKDRQKKAYVIARIVPNEVGELMKQSAKTGLPQEFFGGQIASLRSQ